MKKITWSYKLVITIILLIGVVITFAAAPKWIMFAARPADEDAALPPEEKITYTPGQKAKFKELMAIYSHIDSCKEIFMAGKMTCIDPSDSSQNLNTTFKYCRKFDELYYQTDESEMVALKDMYLAISNNARKILVNQPKTIVSPFLVPADSLIALFQNDSYKMEYDDNDNGTSIRFLCPEHVYCKEYNFEVKNNRLSAFSMRLTDLNDPLNTAKDKMIKVTIDQWEEKKLPVNLLKAQTYVNLQGNRIQPSAAYAGYELINYLNVNAN